MGFFDAFLRGAGGQGLTAVAANMQRNEELRQAREQADKDREDRQNFNKERDDANRQLREQLGLLRSAGGSGSGTRRGGGAGLDDDAVTQAAVARLMRVKGMSGQEALQAYEASRSGVNPYTRDTQTSQSFDDGDRQRNVTVHGTEPDVARYQEINRIVGQAVTYGLSNNPEQGAKAYQTDVETDAAVAGGQGNVNAARTALLLKGKEEFKDGSSGITGMAKPGSLDDARIGSERAQAAERYANADKHKADANKTKADAKDADLIRAEAPYNTRILKLQEDPLLKLEPAKLKEAQAAVRAEMDADPNVQRLRGLVKQPKDEGTKGPTRDKAAQAEQVRSDFRAGKLTRDQAKAKLKALGFT